MPTNLDLIQDLYAFFSLAEKLKDTRRHAWTSGGTQESTAEHTWMVCLMAIAVLPQISLPVDQLRVLKMLIVHDLVEAPLDADIPYFEVSARQQGKQAAERAVLKEMTEALQPDLRTEILGLWEEFEARQTNEAKLSVALDKYEAQFSHAQADITTWNDGDYSVCFKGETLYEADPFIAAMKRHVDGLLYQKLKDAGTLSRINPEKLELFRKSENPIDS